MVAKRYPLGKHVEWSLWTWTLELSRNTRTKYRAKVQTAHEFRMILLCLVHLLWFTGNVSDRPGSNPHGRSVLPRGEIIRPWCCMVVQYNCWYPCVDEHWESPGWYKYFTKRRCSISISICWGGTLRNITDQEIHSVCDYVWLCGNKWKCINIYKPTLFSTICLPMFASFVFEPPVPWICAMGNHPANQGSMGFGGW